MRSFFFKSHFIFCFFFSLSFSFFLSCCCRHFLGFSCRLAYLCCMGLCNLCDVAPGARLLFLSLPYRGKKRSNAHFCYCYDYLFTFWAFLFAQACTQSFFFSCNHICFHQCMLSFIWKWKLPCAMRKLCLIYSVFFFLSHSVHIWFCVLSCCCLPLSFSRSTQAYLFYNLFRIV